MYVCTYVCMFVCMHLCVCVCTYACKFVCNIWIDVKLFLFSFSYFSPFNKAGDRGMQSGTTSNEATWLYGIQSLISAAYLHFSLQWQGAPRTPTTELEFYTVAAIWTYFRWHDVSCNSLDSGFIYVRQFPKTFTVFAKCHHEMYFRSSCLGLLHVTGLSSWWISSKIQFCLVVIPMVTPTRCHRATGGNPF